MKVTDRILKQEKVNWKGVEWLQNSSLKSITEEDKLKLKNSLKKYMFIMPFNVWQDENGIMYFLDGCHRQEALNELIAEGVEVDDTLSANFILCKDRKEAVELVLVYSSIYARIVPEGLNELMIIENISLNDIGDIINIPELDIQILDTEEDTESKEEDLEDIKLDITRESIIKKGDLIELGKHRVLCGDCTNKEEVDRLLDYRTVDMILTDPPYGVDYAGKNEFLNTIYNSSGNDKGNRIETDIMNDDIADYRKFFNEFLSVIEFSEYNTIYIFMLGSELHNLRLAFDDTGIKWSDYLIWLKNNHVLSRKDYNMKHEFIVYGWKGKHKFYGSFSTTVIECNKNMKNDLHPTMKPVLLLEKLIADGSTRGMIIYDGFLGSGSTIIACDNTGRICYGLEIDEHYCDIIIDRYCKYKDNYNIKINGIETDWLECKNLMKGE